MLFEYRAADWNPALALRMRAMGQLQGARKREAKPAKLRTAGKSAYSKPQNPPLTVPQAQDGMQKI